MPRDDDATEDNHFRSHHECLVYTLETSWLMRLHKDFDRYNWIYASSKLRRPNIVLSGSRVELGSWNGRTRTMSIAHHHIVEHPWQEVMETLRHEMAHQYVDEVLGIQNARPHGDPFILACRILRCEPSARAGQMTPISESSTKRDKMLTRVRELLALAESPNEHEAASAMRMARRFLLEYNLDLRELDEKRGYETRFIGKSMPRVQEYHYVLSSILQDHFFVQCIWATSYDAIADQSGRILQIHGTWENLELASYVHDFVLHTADGLWRARKKSSVQRDGTKLQYYTGLLRGFASKLNLQKTELREQHSLVWLADPLLGEYYRHLHPRIQSVSTSGVSRSDLFDAGLEDGRKLHLRRGVSGPAEDRGRQITGPGDA
jgi:hypothetical protein